jgi:hypothetical protein
MVDGENRETPHCNTKGTSYDRTIGSIKTELSQHLE